MTRILLIEDESAIADNVIYALETEGYEVCWFRLGREGIAELERDQSISLVILDVGLPDINGFEVCKAVRRFSEVPIIFLTARNDEVDRVVGLEIGGDDYVSKPFSPRELAARVKVILKRVGTVSSIAPTSSTQQSQCDFLIDADRAMIVYCGQSLELTRYEYLILKCLLSQPERVFSRAQIMEQVWEMPETSLERSVDTHIKSLRTKLHAIRHDDPIKTHRGLGYSITGSVSES